MAFSVKVLHFRWAVIELFYREWNFQDQSGRSTIFKIITCLHFFSRITNYEQWIDHLEIALKRNEKETETDRETERDGAKIFTGMVHFCC